MKEIIDFIKEAKHLVAFTGAGVSVLSGIKDFRGKNGLYKTMDAEKIFDLDVFKRDPSFYYENTKEFIYGLDEKEPAVTHRVLAKLEEMGCLKALITQNIDMLHQKAGSKNVIELHGSAKVHYCLSCGMETSEKRVFEIARAGEVPRCSKCNGVLKPCITFFGESLPIKALTEAIKEVKEADAIIVLGSSLTVYPAAALPSYALDNGAKLMIVNDMETPYDSLASLRYNDLATVFNYLEKEIEDNSL
ncbi:MAG: NAD-dependent protein deacylase [Treponema sp.]